MGLLLTVGPKFTRPACCAARRQQQISIHICCGPAPTSAANPPAPLLLSIKDLRQRQTDRRTDIRTDTRRFYNVYDILCRPRNNSRRFRQCKRLDKRGSRICELGAYSHFSALLALHYSSLRVDTWTCRMNFCTMFVFAHSAGYFLYGRWSGVRVKWAGRLG